jgi:hypothetical protein
MELVDDEIEPLRRQFRRLIEFLRSGPRAPEFEQLLKDFVPDTKDKKLRNMYRSALSQWNGLSPKTPIVFLTNLAPGVDSLTTPDLSGKSGNTHSAVA